MRRLIPYLIISLLILISISVNGQIRIAVSKTSGTYEAWLKKIEPEAVIVNMYGRSVDSALTLLSTCDGLLLTGGEDVNPARYGKEHELAKCEEIDNYRDTLEFALIKKAIQVKMPVFGICRGEQILNVALGGTLLTDIPIDVGTSVIHRSLSSPKGCLHLVEIDKKSVLYQLTGISRDTVNSYHHQSIDKIAPGYKISALSENGVAEAMEPESSAIKSFIMAVQWHPEKPTQKPELSVPLAENFLRHIRDYNKLLK
jgi:gamma-glutamyl-gamma-aminobutyrate hydrolase PuuD